MGNGSLQPLTLGPAMGSDGKGVQQRSGKETDSLSTSHFWALVDQFSCPKPVQGPSEEPGEAGPWHKNCFHPSSGASVEEMHQYLVRHGKGSPGLDEVTTSLPRLIDSQSSLWSSRLCNSFSVSALMTCFAFWFEPAPYSARLAVRLQ